MVKSNGSCSWRGPRFCSQCLHRGLRLVVTLLPGYLTGLCGHQAHTQQSYVQCKQKLKRKIKTNTSLQPSKQQTLTVLETGLHSSYHHREMVCFPGTTSKCRGYLVLFFKCHASHQQHAVYYTAKDGDTELYIWWRWLRAGGTFLSWHMLSFLVGATQ